jgi:hypothetical protein
MSEFLDRQRGKMLIARLLRQTNPSIDRETEQGEKAHAFGIARQSTPERVIGLSDPGD